jgi:4,5-DOPA dioxygenase extradiol
MSASTFRHPVVAVSHGPGPMWLLDDDTMGKTSAPAQALRTLLSKLYPKGEHLPKRILYVSAHFDSESRGFDIASTAQPGMIYDYYGFPSESYDVQYPAKGDPAFAKRVQERLEASKIPARLVDRGFDHGTFVPMLLIRPEADIPIVTMSINFNLSEKTHFELGKALAPFRDEDTLIMCSGQATHNLRAPRGSSGVTDWAQAFQDWLDSTLTDKSSLSISEREEQICAWQKAPGARLAHPTPDHFLPFVVGAGAGMDDSKSEAVKLLGGFGLGHMSFATYGWGVEH